ncbi:MAG: hypothetical protein LBE13_14175 [Bacteroidales bacterium]|jgi:hypothetical protein|nr:hypothetical protein [Bacteroidales bacterium]
MRVVWGTCWFDESVTTISSFLTKVNKVLKPLYSDVLFVVFDAQYNRKITDYTYLHSSCNCEIVRNTVPFYPNKNYGVYSLVYFANLHNSDIIVISDSDWQVANFDMFVLGIIKPLIDGKADIVIPNILQYAGRDNQLIGRQLLKLFYPELLDIVYSPFPGAVAASTYSLFSIISNEKYHFDWGGEWDIISFGYENHLKFISPCLCMENIRHRSSHSKSSDAFQIWRAAFENLQLEKLRQIQSVETKLKLSYFHHLNIYGLETALHGSASTQLDNIVSIKQTTDIDSSVMQLVYAVIAPLALLLDGLETQYLENVPKEDKNKPYLRERLKLVAEIADVSITQAILNAIQPLENIKERISLLSGGFLGDWSSKNKYAAKEEMKSQLCCKVIK